MSRAVVGVASTCGQGRQKSPPHDQGDVGDDQGHQAGDDDGRPEHRSQHPGHGLRPVGREEGGLESQGQQRPGPHRAGRFLRLARQHQAERLETGRDEVVESLGRQRPAVRSH